METVAETPPYIDSSAHLSGPERSAIVDAFAVDPDRGDLMVGTGGARKSRFAGRGKGKSGGYRVISFYARGITPVFLLALFSKGEKDNLTNAERGALQTLTKHLISAYRGKKLRPRP